METNYIAEAFKKLNLLENDFNFSVGPEAADDLRSFVADDVDVPTEEPIIDVAAETADDLQDTYVGKVILECSCCHTRIYKDIADVFIDDETGLTNTNEECPVCHTTSGFNVIGKIEEFTEVKEEPVEDETAEEPIENDDFSEEELHEAFKGLKETYKRKTFKDTDDLTEAIEEVEVKTNEGSAIVSSEDDGKVTVDLRDPTNEAIESDDTSIVPLDTEDIETIETNEAPIEDEDDEHTEDEPLEDLSAEEEPIEEETPEEEEESEGEEFEESLNEGRRSITRVDLEKGLSNLVRKYHDTDESFDNNDLCEATKDSHMTPADLAGLRARRKKDEYLNESIADLTSKDLKDIHRIATEYKSEFSDLYNEFFKGVETINAANSPERTGWTLKQHADTMCKETLEYILKTFRPDLLKKVEDIPADKMCQALDLEDVWIIITDDDPEGLVYEYLNESISRLVETYLRRVYENVASYKVTNIKNENGLVIEGLISFESGKEKPTTFMFESKENSKTGVVYRGLNEMFSNSKNAFILRGKEENNKFIPESLTYRYNTNTINESNESVVAKVSGKVFAR